MFLKNELSHLHRMCILILRLLFEPLSFSAHEMAFHLFMLLYVLLIYLLLPNHENKI